MKKKIEMINHSIIRHGGKGVNILIPKYIHPSIAGCDDGKGFVAIFANGTGYECLKDILACAIQLKENSFIYVPVKYNKHRDYGEILEGEEYKYNLNLVFINYATFQANAADIIDMIKTKVFKESHIEININYPNKEPECWNLRNKLTVKRNSNVIILSANKDIYSLLYYSATRLSEYGDSIEYNKYPPHEHVYYDADTYKSMGITLYYEHDESYEEKIGANRDRLI